MTVACAIRASWSFFDHEICNRDGERAISAYFHPPAARAEPRLLTDADALSAKLPSAPLLASPKKGWSGIALRHFRHPTGDISDVRPHDHVLVVHRSAGVSLEERGDGQVRHAHAAPGHVSVTPAGQPVSRRWHGSSEILLITVGKALVDEACRDLDADPARLHLVPRLATPDGDLDRLATCSCRRRPDRRRATR